jgi:formylglycine-generating enzyme required for sulfatase activity
MKRLRWALLSILGLLLAYAAARLLLAEAQKSRMYAAAEAAATAGQWPEASRLFRELTALDPDYRDAATRLDELIDLAVRALPGEQDAKAEIELLRWLDASADWARLAVALDRSRILIPAGEFLMGSDTGRDDERPQHAVSLDAFEIDRYEVTNVQYRRFVQETGRDGPLYWSGDEYPAGQASYPVLGVSWEEANAYCTWAGKRLPTEAEWEKACRGTDGRLYPWGEAWDPRRGNVDVSAQALSPAARVGSEEAWSAAWQLLRETSAEAGAPGLRPVGSYPEGSSPYGVMDLVGNASEWIFDWYNWGGYSDMPAHNPLGPGPPWNHCVRGSPWHDPVGTAAWVQDMSRCSARNSSHGSLDPRAGFRCARSVAAEQ